MSKLMCVFVFVALVAVTDQNESENITEAVAVSSGDMTDENMEKIEDSIPYNFSGKNMNAPNVACFDVEALKCYDCPLGCTGDDKSKWPTADCGASQQQKVCLKQVVKPTSSPERITRKCVLIPDGKQKYECVAAPGEETKSCETCTTDLCNSAGSFSFSFFAFTCVIAPFLASKFFVH